MFDRFAKNETGSIAVETALVLCFVLVPMLLGLWDVAQIGLGQTQVQEALQDAVTYVAAGNASNTAGVTGAAQSAYGTSIQVSAGAVCYCVQTSSVAMPTSVSCSTASCSNGGNFEQFMTITTSKAVTIPFPVPYLGGSVTVTSSATVRTG
jgi:Flp pilus assembly protein TadG